MRDPSAGPDGRGHLSPEQRRWLLIGNSRWHWATQAGAELELWHDTPAQGPLTLAAGPPPLAWAAVGRLGADLPLAPAARLTTADVPLVGLPAWLGVDRALAGWLAWSQRRDPVLVADAGTVLSLTRVDRGGAFAGGRLIAGLALQLRAMAAGTAALPDPPAPGTAGGRLGEELWPAQTQAAMLSGVARGLAAAVAEAWREVHREEASTRLVISGGDAAVLLPLCRACLGPEQAEALESQSDLALRALVALRPGL